METIGTADIVGEQRTRPGRVHLEHGFNVIIERRRYSSDSSTEIASYSDGYRSDFRFVEETLFRTAKGAFLLVVEGGASSAWRHRVGTGGCCEGHAFIAVSKEQARRWLELRGEDGVIEELFADEIEDA